jgi:hypothetical protein
MKCSPRFLFALSLLLVLGCVGCASYPEEQLKQAQAAMDEAMKNQPEVFASANWQDAKKAWDEAQAQLQEKDYGKAGPTLVRAKNRFEKAGEIAAAKRETVLAEVTKAQHDINVRHTGLKTDLAGARLAPAVRKELEECCQQMELQIEKLNTEINKGDLVSAQTTAKDSLKMVYEGQIKMEKALKKR